MDSLPNNQVLLDKELIHLNHAGVGPWLKNTVDAITQFSQENATYGSWYVKSWERKESELRRLCQQLLNAKSSDDIAFLKNTSEGLSTVAYGFPWKPGDNVVFAEQEFPSNRIVWESLEERFQIEARRIDLNMHNHPEDALVEAMDAKTRIVSVSAVQYSDGLRMQLAPLSSACKVYGALLCVDAIQAMGVVPLDVQTLNIDVAIADAHKWMLAPEGIAIFYVSETARQILQPVQFGWHNISNPGQYHSLDWEISPTATRFECGSLNNLGIAALHASLQQLLEIGIDSIYARVSRLLEQMVAELDTSKYQIVSSLEANRASGILTVRHRLKDNHSLHAYLLKNKVLCAQRANGIRFSPHFYITRDQIGTVCKLLNQY